MPWRDRTRPLGAGAMKGRAAGYWAGFDRHGYASVGRGRRLSRGFGRSRGLRGPGFASGRGWRHEFYRTGLPGWKRSSGYYPLVQEPSPQLQKQTLKNQVRNLQLEIDLVQKRLSEIESSANNFVLEREVPVPAKGLRLGAVRSYRGCFF
jgi:hypothetical protein